MTLKIYHDTGMTKMTKILLEDENRYHMPSLFEGKMLYCKAPLQDQYFETHGGWALSETEKRTAYRPYQIWVCDLDEINEDTENHKRLDIVDYEGDVFCSPHAYRRPDGNIEMTYIRISALGKSQTKPTNNMYKVVLNNDFEPISNPQRVVDCLVQDCYCGVENSRFRATASPIISKPLIYIYDKYKGLQYKLNVGMVSMINRISTVYDQDYKLIFTVPTNKVTENRAVYEHYQYDLETFKIEKIVLNNRNPYKMSLNRYGLMVFSEDYSTENEYKMRIGMGYPRFEQTTIQCRITNEIKRCYQWA